MPTTMPSPVDRGEFRFAGLEAAGTEWRWIEEDMVWLALGTETERNGVRCDAPR